MSSIFEALQRSEAKRLGVASDHTPVLPSELLLAAELGATHEVNALGSSDFGQFQSVAVLPSPGSRLVSLTAQESLGAEKFRFLGVQLRQLQQGRPIKRLLITSTVPEEGKSTVSGNLATSLARKHQQKILLVEGDLRRPSLGSQLGLSHLPGLSEWLQGDSAPIANIYHLEGAGFWFLPAGRPPGNPLELMQSGRLSKLLDRLSAWFDWIVIDSPPVLPLADTSVWMRFSDGILLVARPGTTVRRQLQRGLHVLQSSKLLGVVLNGSKNNDDDKYYQRYALVTANLQGDPWQWFNWDRLSRFRSLSFALPEICRRRIRRAIWSPPSKSDPDAGT
jgi:capsular exopolysaccharide synthesis family protein